MEAKKLIRRLGLFVFALVLAGPAWAQNVSGSEKAPEENYLEIYSKADWKAFCDRVNSGEQDFNVKLMNDVDLGTEIIMAGANNIGYFVGKFDGQGHTLSYNWDATDSSFVAPFATVCGDKYTDKSSIIRNLRIKGKVKSDSGSVISGLIRVVFDKVEISNCLIDVDITNSSDESLSTGMVLTIGRNSGITIRDCIVTGNIQINHKEGITPNYLTAGFIAFNYGTCTMSNCLYLGTNNNLNSKSVTFAPEDATITNCYYLNTCGSAQGEKASEEQLKNGSVLKKLQGGRTDACYWGQVLGEMPELHGFNRVPYRDNYVYYSDILSDWACNELHINDSKPLPIINFEFWAGKVYYNRKVSETKTTVCLPYDAPIVGFKAYTFAGIEGRNLHFRQVSGKLEAYTPYLIVCEDGEVQFNSENATVKVFDLNAMQTEKDNIFFTGTMNKVTNARIAKFNAYILSKGVFRKVKKGASKDVVHAYHCFILPQKAVATPLNIVLEDEPTGIEGVTGDAARNGAVYNLQGQRVAERLDNSVRNRLPAGVYIVGGRKVILR